jgi:UDP-glucose:(heptosyl)LPS alpha-1,3-glucosyltransferase
MKIGIIRRRFAIASGAELYVQRLLTQLVRMGHEVHLIAEHWPCAPEGVEVHKVLGSAFRADRVRVFADSVEKCLNSLDLDCTLSLERTRRQTIFRAGDGVHLAWLAERRKFAPWWKKPFVGVGEFNRQMNLLESEVYNKSNTNVVIANSQMVKTDIERYYGYPSSSVRIIRNGVDSFRMASVNRDRARIRFGLKPSDFVLCFVGSGWERKGLAFVVTAFQRLMPKSNLRLLVAGKGRPLSRVPDGVTFLGPVDDIETVYGASDLMITLPMYEPCANVVTEALCAGLPVITTRRNGAAELLDEHTGTIIDRPDLTDQVVDAILHWVRKNRGPVRMSEARLRDHSSERNAAETVDLVLEVIKSASRY